ncbi:MAG: protein phosphatase 2C domain-containing protein [Ruminiclostridium sp.]|nr:protein phosphatase 2C domain-containing protein [Ruminiclostridium sp.]
MLDGFSYSVMGASHEKRGIVCQDASAYRIGNGFAAAVVADGHGGKKYFRSNVGSQCAVEAALETVEHFYSDPDEFDLRFKADHKRIIKRIEKYAIMLWNEKIIKHFDSTPLTSEELNRFSYEEFGEIPPESYYGTTMVCAVIARGYSWGFQIGDGSLVAVFDDGETSMIMDYEESNPANITSSMCNANASDMFDSFYKEKSPVAIMVSTDGLYTSFGSDFDFLDYHTIIAGQLANPEAFLDSLKNNMKKRSHYGTEDDISVSCVYDKELAVSCQEAIKNKVAENKRLAAERKAKLLNK